VRISQSIALALLAFAAISSRAGDIYVVTSASVSISSEDVREVFLGEKQFAGNTKLIPVENGSLQSDFQSRVLKVDAARYASVWAKKGFRDGLTPPPVRSSDADVISAIKANPGTIGYVSAPSPDVKVIQKY
jgi:hypothetical protein